MFKVKGSSTRYVFNGLGGGGCVGRQKSPKGNTQSRREDGERLCRLDPQEQLAYLGRVGVSVWRVSSKPRNGGLGKLGMEQKRVNRQVSRFVAPVLADKPSSVVGCPAEQSAKDDVRNQSFFAPRPLFCPVRSLSLSVRLSVCLSVCQEPPLDTL